VCQRSTHNVNILSSTIVSFLIRSNSSVLVLAALDEFVDAAVADAVVPSLPPAHVLDNTPVTFTL
jgi:hypothetical protein